MPSLKVTRAIRAFEEAVKAKAFIGTQYPQDYAIIEHNYVMARAKLERLLENV